MIALPSLAYSCPSTLAQALASLRRPGACVYAGGTDLLIALQHRTASTAWIRELVDIKGVTEARGISVVGDALRIGALTTASTLASNALVRRLARGVAEAARVTSAPLVRSRGTVGGNLVTAHPVPDLCTSLLSLEAEVDVAGGRGDIRRISLTRYLTSAMRRKGRHLVIAVRVPLGGASAYEKLAHRLAFSRALFAVAVAVRDGRARVAIGGIGERPEVVRVPAASLAHPALADALSRQVAAFDTLDVAQRRAVVALVRRAAGRVK